MHLQRAIEHDGRSARGRRTARRAAALVALALALAAAAASAGDETTPGPAARGPADDYGRGTPRSAMLGYLEAARSGDYERAASYLDLRSVPRAARETRGPELARDLKSVLDRTLWVDLDALSDEPEGARDDGLAAFRERVGTIRSSAGPVEIDLERVPRADGVRIWKIAAATVARVPELQEEFGIGWLERHLPSVFVDLALFEVRLWQWVALLASLVLASFVSFLAASALLGTLRPLVRRSGTTLDDELLEIAAGPLRLLAGLLLFHLAVVSLGLAVPVRRFLVGTEEALVIFAVAWGLFRVVDLLSLRVARRLGAGEPGGAGLVPLGRKVVKSLILALAAVAALDSFGFDVTALLAGLGVGGIAVALAAQKSVENLFGAVTLMTDRPVRPGDFCRFGEKIGTVEEVGLRSTRVRTLDRTVVTIPNAEFATLQLENFTLRDRIWLHAKLGLRYETTPDQLRFVLIEIRKLLYAHPELTPDPARVRFIGFGDSSLDLEVFAYVRTADYDRFLAVREDVFLRIMDIVAGSGSGFAFPSQTTYLARDSGLDEKRLRAAEERVREWRERGELWLPEFPRRAIDELRDTLDYPADGSASHP
jgi:MscS family membrane protein